MESTTNIINQDNTKDIKFENTESFDIMIIKPNNIESLDYNNPGYTSKLVGESFNIVKKTNPTNFIETIAEVLEINKYDGEDRNSVTQVFYDKPEYIYEMMFLDVRTKNLKTSENENQFASMLNIEGEKIYGNVIILKTYLPNNSDKSMKFDNISKDDLFEILDSRVNTKVVVYQDGEYRQETVRGDMEVYCKHLFEEDYFQKKYFSFLHHHVNVWYLKDEYGKVISNNIISDKIEAAVFFTMRSEEHRGNITLDEIKKIIELSKSIENFDVKKEWIEDEKDSLNRRVIKNKYKVLDYAWKEHLKK